MRAYSYTGNALSNIAHIDDGGDATGVTVGPDGTVFLANSLDGLRAYSFNGNFFSNTAHIYDDGGALGVAAGPDGTVFLANSYDGLRAYSYDGASFTNTDHINNGGNASDVAVGSGGTVFLANWADGLRAYRYGPATGIDDPVEPVPANYLLGQNYPNPFNPETVIAYQLSGVSNVTLEIYNLLGEKIATLVNARQSAGAYRVVWNGRNHAGRAVAAGIYLYRLRAGKMVATRKMILVK